jgi:hypothetical protein
MKNTMMTMVAMIEWLVIAIVNCLLILGTLTISILVKVPCSVIFFIIEIALDVKDEYRAESTKQICKLLGINA